RRPSGLPAGGAASEGGEPEAPESPDEPALAGAPPEAGPAALRPGSVADPDGRPSASASARSASHSRTRECVNAEHHSPVDASYTRSSGERSPDLTKSANISSDPKDSSCPCAVRMRNRALIGPGLSSTWSCGDAGVPFPFRRRILPIWGSPLRFAMLRCGPRGWRGTQALRGDISRRLVGESRGTDRG